MKTIKMAFIVLLCCGNFILGFSQTQQATLLKAGAAKVNITPTLNALPDDMTPAPNDINAGYDRINDSLYTRAVVIDNDSTSAALISVDNGMLSEAIWKNVTEGINEEIGIPVENILLCATHTHSAPFLTGNASNDPIISGYISTIEKSIVDVAKKAKSNLQPARIGYGTGTSYLNVNRDVIDPETRLWTQGPNYDGVSDHTVAVVKIEAVTGDLIATFINFAVHANLMFMSGAISAGIPGGVTNYIEDYYTNFHDREVIALWSMGAAGDQNPVHFGPIMGDAARLQTDAAYARQAQMIHSVGQIMGEEVIRVLNLTKKLNNTISIYGSQKTVTCPGRTRTDTDNRQGKPGSYVDGDPVNIKLSLLRMGDIAICGVNAEVYNIIAQKLKDKSPLTNTVVATITNGASNSGYIPSDDAFQRYTFQVLGSRLKPNCAETSIINGLVEMIDESMQ